MIKKVAIYCRVSTKSEIQQHSLETQIKYYSDFIRLIKEYELVGIYTDVGSGLNTKSRTEFNKLIRACKRGRVDLIITKSISRFARNTLDFLEVLHMLKEKGVDVYFENEKILLSEERSELRMSIIAAIAQEESMARSRNTKWGIEARIAAGTSKLSERVCYGYKKDNNGKLTIDENTVENVKLIFDLYLNGYSLSGIAKELKTREILSPTGKEYWTSTAIDKILANEKYTGNVILQKTYVADPLVQKQLKNEGARNKYFYENNHIAIISQETFDVVQKELKKRSNIITTEDIDTTRKATRYSCGNTLSGKILCGECGRNYRRITTHSGEIVWRCAGRVEKGCNCNSRTVKQSEIDKLLREKFGEKRTVDNMYKEINRAIVLSDNLEIIIKD